MPLKTLKTNITTKDICHNSLMADFGRILFSDRVEASIIENSQMVGLKST
jgi:hypothetical protein